MLPLLLLFGVVGVLVLRGELGGGARAGRASSSSGASSSSAGAGVRDLPTLGTIVLAWANLGRWMGLAADQAGEVEQAVKNGQYAGATLDGLTWAVGALGGPKRLFRLITDWFEDQLDWTGRAKAEAGKLKEYLVNANTSATQLRTAWERAFPGEPITEAGIARARAMMAELQSAEWAATPKQLHVVTDAGVVRRIAGKGLRA